MTAAAKPHARLAFAVDAALALVLLAIAAAPYGYGEAAAAHGGPDAPGQYIPHLVMTVALVVPLAWRRTSPLVAAMLVVVACLVQLVAGVPLVLGQVSVLIVVATLVARGPRRVGIAAGVLALGGIVLAAVRYAWDFGDPQRGFGSTMAVLAVGWLAVSATWLSAELGRARQLERKRLVDEISRGEEERLTEQRLAVAEERARIAREMHDIIGHSLSVIIAQSDGAGLVAAAEASAVRSSLAAISETARTSLDDIRHLLGVVQQRDLVSIAPSPGLADLHDLVDGVRASGLPVALITDCSRQHSAAAVPPGMQAVLYRVVQESLTNVLRHAGARATAQVEVESGATTVVVSIADTGRGLDDSSAAWTGHGLIGMRERVALYGGRLDVESRPGGGVRVRAELPVAVGGAQ